MKLRRIVTGIFSVMLATTAGAQIEITSTSPNGYLSRGIQMYESGNYGGAIDQLTHLQNMAVSDNEREQSDYYIAKSYFQRGQVNTALYLLSRYLTDYPTSFNIPDVYATIGDVYFYEGYFAQAITAYGKVNRNALALSHSEDVTYRLAYAELRVKAGDVINGRTLTEKDVEACRTQALSLFDSLNGTARYRDASRFYKAYLDYENEDYDNALSGFSSISRISDLGYHAQYYMCQIYYMKGDWEKTISLGTALLSDENGNNMDAETARIVGESYYRNDNIDDAVKYIKRYIDTSDGEPMLTAQYILGVLNYRNAEYPVAIEQLGKVSQDDGVLGQSAYYYLGQSYRKQEKLQLAAMAFEKAAKQDYSKSTQEAAFYNYAVIQNEGGRTPFNNAIDMFEDFLQKFPNSKYADEVSEYMMTLYMTGNDYPKALASISRIKSPSKKVLAAKQVVLYNLGVNALSNDNVTESQKYLQQARKLSAYDKKLDAQNSLWLGECAYRTGDFAQAAKYQNEYLKAVDSGDANYGLGYYNLGYSRFSQQSYKEARNAFTKALASGKLTTQMINDANNRIGDTYYYAKDFKTAQKYYEKSSGDYALYQKGMMLGLEKDYSGKVAQMKALIKKYPSSSLVPTAMLEEADAYVSMNNNKKAVAVYDELIKAYPNNAYARKAMLNKAITERNANNEAAALDAYKEVVSKYPTSEEASIALEDMKLIYAERGELDKLSKFVSTIKNAPKLDVNDMDRLTFEAAEKAYMTDNNSISKMKAYLSNNPNGAYAPNAKYYIAKYNYNKGNESEALEMLDEVTTGNDDASFIEDALAMKASILANKGKNKEALKAYKKLEEKASNADNRLIAQLGIMRVAAKSGDNSSVVESANALLKNGGLTAEEEKEVSFCRGEAYYKQGKTDSATKDFSKLATDGRNLYGAQSAYYLAEIQYKAGELKKAEKTLNNFIDEGTTHQYWLARGFILLADVYHKQGNSFEACEYLESLKSNYPGNEKDIFKMIDERLNKWKTETKKK